MPEAAPGPWRCPRCGADRAAEDSFCGRCGAPRPVVADGPTEDKPGEGVKGHLPLARALALNGLILAAVLVAFLLGRSNGGPTTIAFEPRSWRCDGSERTWVATIPASAPEVRLDWLAGGPAGQVLRVLDRRAGRPRALPAARRHVPRDHDRDGGPGVRPRRPASTR